MTPPTGSDALRTAIATLRAADIADAPRDARLLLAHATGIPPDRLTLHLPDPVPPGALTRFQAAVAARASRQPLAQITGQRLFWGRRFRVTPDVLDPRPETELLVQTALQTRFARMLDLGTGSGCILLSCLAEMPLAQGLGTDLSPAALAVARSNAQALSLADRAQFLRSDWFGAVSGFFDLIVSNPPYIAAQEMAGLSPEVRDHEPHLALTPGGDGLDAYRAIAGGASAHLLPGGRLMLEIGPTQRAAVTALLTAAGLPCAQTLTDLDGRDRVVVVTKPA